MSVLDVLDKDERITCFNALSFRVVVESGH